MGERVAVIGLGVMGKPMASNLLDAGFDLRVNTRTPGPDGELAERGATIVDSPADVGDAEFVITMVPDTPDVELIGERLIPVLAEGSTWIDCSTISPVTTRRLAEETAEAGASMLDAPVSGGEKGAIDGTLSIMVGGTEESYAHCRGVFEAIGETIVHMGPSGSGQVTKATNQIVVGLAMEAMAEALVLGRKAGIEPARLVEVLLGGLARSGTLELRGKRAAHGDFEPGFRARLHEKDLRIALETGQELGVPLPGAETVAGIYDDMIERGLGDLDHSAVVKRLGELAGVHFTNAS